MEVFTRDVVLHQVRTSGLDPFDVEDTERVVDVMLEAFTAFEVLSWLIFYDAELDGTPVLLVRDGRIREVMAAARQLVSSRVTLGEAMNS